jgi:hypothetical protein
MPDAGYYAKGIPLGDAGCWIYCFYNLILIFDIYLFFVV